MHLHMSISFLILGNICHVIHFHISDSTFSVLCVQEKLGILLKRIVHSNSEILQEKGRINVSINKNNCFTCAWL